VSAFLHSSSFRARGRPHPRRTLIAAASAAAVVAALLSAAAPAATASADPSAVGPVPNVPSPAAHWTFDEGSGTSAADSSGNGHTATLGSAAGWSAGEVGSHALALNGTADSVATATGPAVNTAESFTASAWVKFNALGGYQTVLSIAGQNVAGFFLGLRGDTGTLSFARLPSDADGTATVVASTVAPTTGVWYDVVAVDDVSASTMSIYLDGRFMGSTPYTTPWEATGDTLIGHGFYSGGEVDYVNGDVDDVQLFSSALSSAQVYALYEPAAYSFDDGAGGTATDVSGHGHTLTLGSGASWTRGYIGSNALALNGTAAGNATYAGPVLNTAEPFTVSCWVKLNSLSGYQTFLSINGTTTSGFYLQLRGDTGRFAFTRLASDSDAATAYHADATSPPKAGVWYNLVGVNDVADGQILLYVNGILQSSVAYSGGWQATGATVVGGGLFNGARADFVHGDVDQAVFYDAALSAQDATDIGTDGGSAITVDTAQTGATVSPTLFGAFMENINNDSDGGMDDNETENPGFNDSTNALNGWSAVADTGVSDTLTSDTGTGPTSALTQSGELAIASGVSAKARAGIANTGYFGLAVAPSTTYEAQFWAKASPGFRGPLTVDLESTTGSVYATATVRSISTSWKQYTEKLVTPRETPTTATNRLVISTNSASANGATLWFGAAYLYPPSYEGAANHLRIDLMQKLAALHPAVFRVPGGNYLEGDTYATRFDWSTTVGPDDQRPGHFDSAWGYWSTDGMGLDEYLQMAEEVGAKPILAVYAGYTLDGSSDTGATLAADVTDAVDELHYCLDPVTTPWGAERAANGHPAPYDLADVEIGNEDFFSSTYATRYPLFYDAIHAAFPDLKVIATSSATGGAPYDVLDEHFYEPPAWMETNSGYFDDASRDQQPIFVGEYASMEGYPTGDLNAAIGDASWLLGLERNSDLVTMSSYAPLFVNVNGYEWAPDLIGFDDLGSYGGPSYWEQLMLSHDHGTTVVDDSVSGTQGLVTLVTRTGSTYYLTVVNTEGSAHPGAVTLSGVRSTSRTAAAVTLSGPTEYSTNWINTPTTITPVDSTVHGIGPSFDYTFPAYSITVLKFSAH
jgi:alpha-L-arabinofuranosidase